MANFLVDENGKVKVFGFRSGKLYKMIIAFLYYVACAYIVVTSIVNEFKYYSFEAIDIVLVIIKYIFIIIFLFSPLIFLSDFKYVYNIPLFKKKEKAASAIGIIIVLAICYFMMQLNIYVGSNLYKSSVKEYSLKTTAQVATPKEKEIGSNELQIMLAKNDLAKGYEVQVSTEKDFKSVLIISNQKKNECKVQSPKLANQKKLFVRARTFGTVLRKEKKGNRTIKKIVKGPWSDAKEVKVVTPKKKTTEVQTTVKQTDKKQKETKKEEKKVKETKKK